MTSIKVILQLFFLNYTDNKEPTIGAAFLTKKCKLDEVIIKFEIWDVTIYIIIFDESRLQVKRGFIQSLQCIIEMRRVIRISIVVLSL